jgi:peptidyl-tRNA hydrolase, PTH2 family
MALKQVILVRKDLNMPAGKMAAQVAHAALEAALKSDRGLLEKWLNQGSKKVVLAVKGKKELFMYKQQAENAQLKTALIIDAGHTVLEPGTITCLAIGPYEESAIDIITGKLPMLE